MSRTLRLYAMLVPVCMSVFDVAGATASDIVIEVPAAGGWFDTIADPKGSPTSTEILTSTGRLKLEDTATHQNHYCTAEVIRSPGTTANVFLLLTAAHCLRPDLGFVSFTSENGMQVATSAAATCKLRNRDWRDPPLTDPPNQFINARLDYGFIRLDPTRTPHWNAFPVDWAGTWKVANPLRFKDRIQVVGYPDPNGTGQGQLETLSTNDLTILPDFYHQKLNRISTKHISFTKGTSGGAWLDVKNPHAPKIVSLTSAYVGVPVDANAGQYITIYGPILHQDAMTLAAAAGDDSQTTGYSDCQ